MTEDNLTRIIGQTRHITTTVGSQAFHYCGVIISISKTHITINDKKEGTVSIPIQNALIREGVSHDR